jgi:hypothetical protein
VKMMKMEVTKVTKAMMTTSFDFLIFFDFSDLRDVVEPLRKIVENICEYICKI